MKIETEQLRISLQSLSNIYADSRRLAQATRNYYHGKHYTEEQLKILNGRGQPSETHNVIRAFSNLLIGYFTDVNNSISLKATKPEDIKSTSVLKDVLAYVLRKNNYSDTLSTINLSGMLSGLMIAYTYPKVEQPNVYSKAIYDVGIEYVPENEFFIDDRAMKPDYSDARVMHRCKWLGKEVLYTMFNKADVDKLALQGYAGEDTGTDEQFRYNSVSYHREEDDSHLVVHSVVYDNKNELHSVYWSGDVLLQDYNLTTMGVPNPYVVVRVSNSTDAEYYGVFEGLVESQKAINQAIIKIQLLANTHKVLVEQDAVEDMDEFIDRYNSVNAVIPIGRLSGVKVERLTADINDQLKLIEGALTRFKQVLGVNDAFLGNAMSGDSGRKLLIQKKATLLSLKYITDKMKLFQLLMGKSIIAYIKLVYKEERILRVTDEEGRDTWTHINKPLYDEQGKPMRDLITNESNTPLETEDGQMMTQPLNDPDTEFSYDDTDIEIKTTSYVDDDELNSQFVNEVLNGTAGNALLQMNPAGFMMLASKAIRGSNYKMSSDIADIYAQTAQMLQQSQQTQPQVGQGAGQNMQGDLPSIKEERPIGRPTQ